MNTKNTLNRFDCVDEVVGTVVNLGLSKPPFITHPHDENSQAHKHNCMAWWLASTKTHAQSHEFLSGQHSATQHALKEPIAQCYAWIWLLTLSSKEIRQRLSHMHGDEAVQFKTYLNHYRSQAKESLNSHRL